MSKEESNKSQPLNTLAQGAVDGAGAFLGRICLPAAEEFGLLLRDKVGFYPDFADDFKTTENF